MPPPLLDLHAHFPMHTRFPPRFAEGPPPIDKAAEFWAANMLLNYRGGRPRVDIDEFLAGQEGGIASVLYDPEDEFFHDAAPRPEAFGHLKAQLRLVEKEINDKAKGKIEIVRNPSDVEACIKSRKRFLLHCIEGGFGFGGVTDNVNEIAQYGIAYVVIAHLFFRGVAACENALPFVPDEVFKTLLNPQQRPEDGLTALGRDIVDRVYAFGMIADITHSNQRAQDEIFEIAKQHSNAPVISSHTGVRPTSGYPLNLSPNTVQRIADSGGVVGIILGNYWLRQPNEQVFGPDDWSLLFKAIQCVRDITGSFDNVAIGSDLDGFIHPIKGCPTYAQTGDLARAIEAQFGASVAERILYANALETLGKGWTGVPSTLPPALLAE